MFRGGAYKPRTSPYAFQGLGQEGLRLLAEAKAQTGLPIVTEVMDARDLDAVLEVADVLQIGARNMQNYTLLSEVGRCGRPALLKRGLSSTLDELLMAAEYILKEGNEAVILCERGIRTFETAYRFTLDLMAIPVLKATTHLPVIVDPSHAAGRRDLVEPMSLAAAAAGADGIIVEVHPRPGRGDLRRRPAAADRRVRRLRSSASAPRPRPSPARCSDVVTLTGLSRSNSIRDQRIERLVPLASPRALIEELPLSDEHAEVLLRGRAEVQAILDGHDDRLLVVVGPCSVHDVDGHPRVRRAAGRRGQAAAATTCAWRCGSTSRSRARRLGWKGLINDPHLDGSGDVNTGLRMARRLLLEVLALGLPVGCEFLDPITPQYISDAVCWGAIGARTVESQIHRQLGSGLSMPVGFKNRTDGNVQVAVDAVRAAGVSHAFAGIDENGTPAILYTRGNADCHVILRGGKGAPNYDAESVAAALELLRAAGAARARDDRPQPRQQRQGPRAPAGGGRRGRRSRSPPGSRPIFGVMLESFLVAGRQDLEQIPPTRSSTASRSPTAASAGTRRSRCSTRSPRAVRARRDAGAESAPGMRIAVIGVGLIGGSVALAARERLERLGRRLRPVARGAARRRSRAARSTAPPRRVADAVDGAEAVFVAAPGRRAAGARRRGAGRRRRRLRGHRRRLDQARDRRRPRRPPVRRRPSAGRRRDRRRRARPRRPVRRGDLVPDARGVAPRASSTSACTGCCTALGRPADGDRRRDPRPDARRRLAPAPRARQRARRPGGRHAGRRRRAAAGRPGRASATRPASPAPRARSGPTSTSPTATRCSTSSTARSRACARSATRCTPATPTRSPPGTTRAAADRRRLLEAQLAGGELFELRASVPNRPGVVAAARARARAAPASTSPTWRCIRPAT